MPWTESTKMDEKLRFVSRFLDEESISALCREFGISRVTGHKIVDRYKESGMKAFTHRSRKPFRQANSFGRHSIIGYPRAQHALVYGLQGGVHVG